MEYPERRPSIDPQMWLANAFSETGEALAIYTGRRREEDGLCKVENTETIVDLDGTTMICHVPNMTTPLGEL